MSALQPLRGGCQCGRNRYIIAIPQERMKEAQVLFNTDPVHQIPLATPLAAYIRVPLPWFHSSTHPLFPDETHSMIRRVYTHPTQQHSKRQFCGFCGTPLSYWSEDPETEAEYISLTLGSLLREDLRDIEDIGLIPDEDEDTAGAADDAGTSPSVRSTALRQSYGVPWFEAMVEGTRLGKMRRSQGVKRSRDGRVKVEWEVVEFSSDHTPLANEDGDGEEGAATGKRKLNDRDENDVAA